MGIKQNIPVSPPNSKRWAGFDLCTFLTRMAAPLWMKTLVFSSFRRYRDTGKLKSSFFTLINSSSSFKRAQFSVQMMTSETTTAHVRARAQSGTILGEGKNTGERLSEEEILVNSQTDKKPMEVAIGSDASLPGQDMTKEGSAEPPRDLKGQGGIDGGGDDKYLYMQRGFTSEIFKIEIRNIPKYFSYSVRFVFSLYCTCDLINRLRSVGKSICSRKQNVGV